MDPDDTQDFNLILALAVDTYYQRKRFRRQIFDTFKVTRSATMNIFRNVLFSFKIICKSRIKLCFHNKSVHNS